MSPTSWLQQISTNGLRRTKHNPDIFQFILMDLTPANVDEPMLVTSLSALTEVQLDIVNSVTPQSETVVNRWSILDIELLEIIREYEPDLFLQLKEQLFCIVEDERRCAHLDIGRAWFPVRLILQHGTCMEPFETVSAVESKKRINIFSGKPVYSSEKFVDTRYQEPDVVAGIAQSLTEFDDNEFRRRFEYVMREQPTAYGEVVLEEEYYEVALEYCKDVQKFYITAETQGFGVINVLS